MKNKFAKKKKLTEDMALQITSMADIFVILLVFLLKNYSSTLTSVSPTGEMNLPVAQAQGEVQDTLKLEITMKGVLVDQKQVVDLNAFRFKEDQVQDSGEPEIPYSEPIYQVLQRQRGTKPLPNKDSNLLVLADERTPYMTIKKIMASAAKAGFVDLQLVVVTPQ
jgi:biopolymer transport protein ExbD